MGVFGAIRVVCCVEYLLAEIHQTRSVAATSERNVFVYGPLSRSDGFIMSRHHPSRRALKDR